MEERVLQDLIEKDRLNKKKMYDGVDYYKGKNDILSVDFRKFYVNGAEYIDYNKANTHIVNNFHKKLVDQKVGYIAGEAITLKADEEFLNDVQMITKKQFTDTMAEYAKGASNKGVEALHPYINSKGEFDYIITPAEEIIWIYDTAYEKELLNVIRYYKMEWQQGEETKCTYRVEVWDKETVTYYQEVDGQYTFIAAGTMGIDENPKPHWKEVNTATGQVTDNAWGVVPFIKLQNNTEETTDLEPIKPYIDALDMVSSGFVNDLKDVQLAIWVLRGYEGEDLADFMLNLQHFKAIKLEADDSASAEPKTMDIPKEARETLLKWLEDKIYQIGQGVNEGNITGNPTNVVIKAMYSGLDRKASLLINKMKNALQEFMWFVVKYINETYNKNYNYQDIDFVFNKAMIFNKLEIVDMIQKSLGIISNETLIANHPFVDDLQSELDRISNEMPSIMLSDNVAPKPQSNESQERYMERCVEMLQAEGIENPQAICLAKWSE